MASGLPVITNITGDLPLVLHNKQNGYLLNYGTLEELVDTFNEILDMTDEEYKMMSTNAVQTVHEMLVPNRYNESLDLFLDSIIENRSSRNNKR